MTNSAATRIAYVAFPGAGEATPHIAGKLVLPSADPPLPAVVICHGSDGVDGRGEFHAAALNAAGIATLEIDMWAARGVARGASARPGSPLETLPDAFGALAFLAAQPEVEPARIGVMGFSWGGVVTLLSTRRDVVESLAPGGRGFAAHAAFYPVCWAYAAIPALSLAGRTGAPILIHTGGADAYDPPGAAETLVTLLKTDGGTAEIGHRAYPGATHGFDRDLPAQTIVDAFSHGGKGGEVLMAFDPGAATAARAATVAFFSRALGAAN